MRALFRRTQRPARPIATVNVSHLTSDLRESQTNEAALAAQLTAARQQLDVEAARAAAFEQRAEAAEHQHAALRELLQQSHRDLIKVTAERDRLKAANSRLQRSIDECFGYTDAEIAAIESGAGEPRKS